MDLRVANCEMKSSLHPSLTQVRLQYHCRNFGSEHNRVVKFDVSEMR